MKRESITKVIKASLIIVILTMVTQFSYAQVMYTLAQNTAVEIKVLGKTNTNDLVINTAAMKGQGKFKFDGQNLDDITALSFNLSAQDILDKKTANKRVFKAFNTTGNPTISYTVKCATVTPTQNNKYGIILGGELTVGSITQLKCMLLSATMNADSTITLTGHTSIQLTDDNLKSVKFMQGPVKVDNDLAIQFTIVYKKDAIQDAPLDIQQNNIYKDYITKL